MKLDVRDRTGKKVRAIGTCLVAAGLDRIETVQLDAGQAPALHKEMRHAFDVAVARAVVGQPTLVLADEPTANLDSHTSDSLMDVMERLNREHGTTFLFSTSDPRVMERARRRVSLVDGQIVSDERG